MRGREGYQTARIRHRLPRRANRDKHGVRNAKIDWDKTLLGSYGHCSVPCGRDDSGAHDGHRSIQ
jgi:hypothetical protein